MKDALDHTVPKHLQKPFEQATMVRRRISRIADEVRMLGHISTCQAMARVDTIALQEHLRKLVNDLLDVQPYAMCEVCLQAERVGDFTCPHCQGTGWVTKAELNRAFESGLESVWWRGEEQFVDQSLQEVLSCKTIQ